MTVARDNFNRANSGTLGANWTANSGAISTVAMGIASNNAVPSVTGGNAASFWNADSFGTSQYSQVILSSNALGSSLHGGGPTLRGSAGDNYYRFLANLQNIASNLQIAKVVNGTFTQLATATRTMALGDQLRFYVIGSTLNAYVNGVLVITVQDTSLTTGAPGVCGIQNSGAQTLLVDDWEGGDITPFSQVIVRDSFTRADSGTLGANWTSLSDATDTATIGVTSNKAQVQTTGGNAASFWSANAFQPDQYAQTIINGSALGTSSHGGGPIVRGSAGGNYYRVFANLLNGAGNILLGKNVAGTFTGLTSATVTLALGDLARLEVVGSQLTVLINGTQVIQTTDSSLTSGSPGLCAFSQGPQTANMDNWEGGDLLWTRLGTVIPIGAGGGTQEPNVLYEQNPQILSANPDGKIWKMWHANGWGAPTQYYAESNDSVNWTEYGSNPVISDAGLDVAHGFILHFGSTYYGYFTQSGTSPTAINLWQSTNGVTAWSKTNSNVLTIGGAGEWDHLGIANPVVWVSGSTWYMLYEGRSVSNYSAGLATSPDGVVWTKYGGNPVNSSAGSTDMGKMAPFTSGALQYLVAHGSPTSNLPSDIYLWSSPDLHAWTGAARNPIYIRTTSDEGANVPSAGQVADPSFVELNGTTYLFHDATDAQVSGHIHIKAASCPYTIQQITGMIFGSSIISGSVGAAGVTVNYSGAASGSVTSDANGNYVIPVTANGTYTIIPSKTGVTFNPGSQNAVVSGADVSGINFSSGGGGTTGLSMDLAFRI